VDRQLTIEPRGENFLLKFHDYEGPFEGHQITRELGVREVKPPADGTPDALAPGEGFLVHAMDYHPDLVAVVTRDSLEPLVRLIDRHNVTVCKGKEHLPALHIEHPDENYIDYLEKLHVPVWHRGPKAVTGAILIRAIPALLVIGALVVASRHYGDHYRDVSVEELFAMTGQPRVEQSAIGNFFNPDHSHLVRIKVHSIRFMRDNRFIMADGNYLMVDGLDRIQPIFELAGMRSTAPTFDIDLQSGEALVQQLRLGDDVQARNVVLKRVAALGDSDAMPPRGGNGDNDGRFQEFSELPYDDTVTLENVLGQKVSLTGTIVQEGQDYMLRMANGAKLVLDVSQATEPMHTFLAAFNDGSTEVEVDVVVRRIYDWRDRQMPERSRGETKFVGEATLYSASAQNYHIVARR
jgi:hypothetical protein